MPVTKSYRTPGVYVEEVPSGPRPIQAVGTSTAGFIGVVDPTATMRAVEAFYEGTATTINHLDGVTIEFSDWWFNLRPSNTEPLLRLNVEASDRETMERERDALLELIRSS